MGGGTALVNAEGPLPEMKDRLRPDFNNPSTKFQAAACNPNNFASSISDLVESMLALRPSPEDPQLQAMLQESAAYAVSTSSTFEDDTQAAMKQSVLGTGAPDILGVYDDNDPEYWEHEFRGKNTHLTSYMSIKQKMPASVTSSMSIKPESQLVDLYGNGNISSGSSHPSIAPVPKKCSSSERTDEFVGLVSNVAMTRYAASIEDGTPGTQYAALELMDTLAGNGDKTALIMIRSKANMATPAAGEEEKAADRATQMINHRKKRQQQQK